MKVHKAVKCSGISNYDLSRLCTYAANHAYHLRRDLKVQPGEYGQEDYDSDMLALNSLIEAARALKAELRWRYNV